MWLSVEVSDILSAFYNRAGVTGLIKLGSGFCSYRAVSYNAFDILSTRFVRSCFEAYLTADAYLFINLSEAIV